MDNNRNQIEEIKEKLDIVGVIEKYVNLKPAGKNYQGLCPFHNEKTPSFIVSPDIQRYKCFGCGKTGDIFNFIQDIENLDFPETLEKLAKDAGVTLQKFEKNNTYSRLEEINYLATKYFYNELKKDKKASKYLEERGFTQESIKNFGIGYTPKYPKLLNYLQTKGKFSKKELMDSGLFTLKENKLREKFYDRIMFPIRSSRGKVIAFSGRILPDNKYGPKYMNSPETPIYHKKDNLFGQYESRQEIRKQDLAILCEGQTDVISAHQKDIKNIVAPLGTGLTKEQVEKLKRLSNNLLFFFDSDQAGQQAVVRGFKIASEAGANPFATSPEPYKDIDELLQKEPKIFDKKVKNKQDAFTFLVSKFIEDKNLNKLEDQNRTYSFIKDLLSSVSNQNQQNYYTQKAQKLTKLLFDKANTPSSKTTGNTGNQVKQTRVTKEIYYLQYLTLLDSYDENYVIDPNTLQSPEIGKILGIIQRTEQNSRESLYEEFRENPELKTVLEEVIFHPSQLPENQEEIKDEITRLMRDIKVSWMENKQKELSVRIAIEEEKENSKESKKLLEEFQDISKLLKELKND